MKKVLSVLLCVVLIMGMTGCQSKATDGIAEEPTWPTGDVTMLVPSRAGGNTDSQVRLFAKYMQDQTGHNFIVQNLSEGKGTVAYDKLKKSDPDGSSLMLYHASFLTAVLTGVYEADLHTDYTTIATAQNGGYPCIVVREDSPYQTLEDLVKDAKARPGEIKFGTSLKKIPNLFPIMLEDSAGIDLNIIDAENEVDLLGGHINVTNLAMHIADQNVQAGKMRILGVVTPERCPYFPEYPTCIEQGYEGVEITGNFILFGPAGMDPEIVEIINGYLKGYGDDPEVKKQLEAVGRTFQYRNVEESRAAFQAEIDILEGRIDVLK